MQAIDAQTLNAELAAQRPPTAQVTFEQLHDTWMNDQSPNKGTEDDYLERKLASGWRRSPDGKGIWCISNPQVSDVPLTNTPDPSLFKNPGPPQHDNNGPPAEVAENKDDLKPPGPSKSAFPSKPR